MSVGLVAGADRLWFIAWRFPARQVNLGFDGSWRELGQAPDLIKNRLRGAQMSQGDATEMLVVLEYSAVAGIRIDRELAGGDAAVKIRG